MFKWAAERNVKETNYEVTLSVSQTGYKLLNMATEELLILMVKKLPTQIVISVDLVMLCLSPATHEPFSRRGLGTNISL